MKKIRLGKNKFTNSDNPKEVGRDLMGCILIVTLVCFAQIRGNRMLLLGCLFMFLLFAVWQCDNKKIMQFLLFFLPWSPLLKLYNGGISFFTIALLIVCVYSMMKMKFVFEVYQITVTATLMVLTLTAKAIQGNSISNNYLCFLIMLFLFPFVIKYSRQNSFWELTLFFACGIITAALSAQQVAGYSNISQYIKVDSYLTITRLSGFYGDSNFYVAHITACMSGILLLLLFETDKVHRGILAVLAVVLIYCGLLSGSKSFILVMACLFFAWILLLLGKGNYSSRFSLFIGILCAGGIVLSSSAFRNLFQIVDERFSYASNISEFTTGRTDVWLRYLNEFSHNFLLTLLGEGYTDVVLYNKASHNTIIQGIFQFGIIGFLILSVWIYQALKPILVGLRKGAVNWKCVILMCVGVVLPWMALDILFFDELFILPVYIAIGIVYSDLHGERIGF